MGLQRNNSTSHQKTYFIQEERSIRYVAILIVTLLADILLSVGIIVVLGVGSYST